jgi:hypothetical protein
MKSVRAIAFVLFVSVVPTLAQKLPDKPFTEWSKDAALKILSDSPWAKTYSSIESRVGAQGRSIARTQRDTVNRGGGNPGSVAIDGGNLPIVIRLHSAVPVRQATVRLQQLDVKYDKMNETERKAFDSNRKGFLDCAICKDYYVVTITKFTDNSGERTNDGIFQTVTLEDIKGNVTLVNDQGEKRELIQFTPSKGAGDPSIFFFKRLDESGKPLLTPDSKELQFVFSQSFIDWNKRDAGLYPRQFEFSIPKILVGGEVMF